MQPCASSVRMADCARDCAVCAGTGVGEAAAKAARARRRIVEGRILFSLAEVWELRRCLGTELGIGED